MVYFKETVEGGRHYLCVTADSTKEAKDDDHKFHVRSSMLRPSLEWNPCEMRRLFPPDMATDDKTSSRPTYFLKSCVESLEVDPIDVKPFVLGRKILDGLAKWGNNSMRVYGEAAHIPLYWEWTEDILSRFASRLKDIGVYDAVYASLYTYERNADVMRAFCESWCPLTNTLHTEVGEWSISLRDLQVLGGLPVAGRLYDEAIPSYKVMTARDKNGHRRIPRTCEYLFKAYCILADRLDDSTGVSAAHWIEFWCKQKRKYDRTCHPSGQLGDRSSDWESDQLDVFLLLEIDTDVVRETSYLAAFFVGWLSTFTLPVDEKRMIRPSTFEVAAKMADGLRFSLAPAVLANIYHGLNGMVNADKPSWSQSYFPAHYLYVWLAHYFGTHRIRDDRIGPEMVQYSGMRGAKSMSHDKARELIHNGSSFKASSLVLVGNRCEPVCDDQSLSEVRFSYFVSLRSAYLPLRSKGNLFLEPYNPTRFSRQFGFCQDIPRLLPRRDDIIPFKDAFRHLKMFLFEDSRSRVIFPGHMHGWRDMTTESFRHWWPNVTVTDLREGVAILASSVVYNTKNKALEHVPATKRVPEHCEEDSCAVNFNHRSTSKKTKTQVSLNLARGGTKPTNDVVLHASHLRPALIEDEDAPTEVQLALSNGERPISPADPHICSTFPPLSSCTVGKNNAFKRNMVKIITNQCLMQLKATPYEEVEHVAMTDSDACYGSIRAFGGDPSALKDKVDSFVSRVRGFLAAKAGVIFDDIPTDHDVAEVYRSLQSSRATLEEARQAVQLYKKQLLSLEEKKAKLVAEEASVKAQCDHQLEQIRLVEPEVINRQRHYQNLRDSQSRFKDLKGMEHELDKLREHLNSDM